MVAGRCGSDTSRIAIPSERRRSSELSQSSRTRGSSAEASTCKRYENGQVTASGLSSFNIQSWRFNLTRRTLIIDEEAGITWGMYPFTQAANSLVVGEAFKLVDGKITMIQAVMAYQPWIKGLQANATELTHQYPEYIWVTEASPAK